MPYQIKSLTPYGFKVCKIDPATECFSKRGLPYKRALAQMRAIIISENGVGVTQSRSSKKISKKTSKKTSKKSIKKTSKKGGSRKTNKKPIKKTSKKVSKKLKPKKPSKK
jgi:hypothetical protein